MDERIKRCREKGISCIFYDFDGVMTNNKVIVDENGVEAVTVSRGDGNGISEIRKAGIRQIIVSTESNRVVEKRAEKLHIPVLYGIEDKKKTICDYAARESIDLCCSIFVGNDTNDLCAYEVVGIKAAPKDAEPEILQKADWVSEKNGGDGVIRDLYRWMEREGLL